MSQTVAKIIRPAGRSTTALCALVPASCPTYDRVVISVVDYDDSWPVRFEALPAEYAQAMSAAGVAVIAIEHVGSTAVLGLSAKTIIDCDIVVHRGDVEAAAAVLIGLGFAPLGELGSP